MEQVDYSQAECRKPENADVNYFPERGQSTNPAKAVCRLCVIREDCLQDNIKERFGVIGGLSERERRRIRSVGRVSRICIS